MLLLLLWALRVSRALLPRQHPLLLARLLLLLPLWLLASLGGRRLLGGGQLRWYALLAIAPPLMLLL